MGAPKIAYLQGYKRHYTLDYNGEALALRAKYAKTLPEYNRHWKAVQRWIREAVEINEIAEVEQLLRAFFVHPLFKYSPYQLMIEDEIELHTFALFDELEKWRDANEEDED